MEEFQISYLKKHLDQLVSLTSCTEPLLIRLSSQHIISHEESLELIAKPLKRDQALSLYKILMTRIGAYDILLVALKETKQLGACQILDENFQKNRNSEMSVVYSPKNIQYDKMDIIGRGNKGSIVYRGKIGSHDVAVKKIWSQPECIEDIFEEAKKLCLLENDNNIIRHFCAEQKENHILIAVELCDRTLQDWISRREATQNIKHKEIIFQITSGIAFLHKNNVLHCNLQPENVLISGPSIKLSDFGVTRSRINLAFGSDTHTTGWMAPEILHNSTNNADAPFTFASDVFSLGCIFYYVLSEGSHPFGDVIRRETNILHDRHSINPGKMKQAKENIWLISAMISKRDSTRPPASALVNNPALWESSKSLRFLESTANYLQTPSQTLHNYWDKLQDYANYVTTDATTGLSNWQSYLCKDLQRYSRAKCSSNSYGGLIVFISDLYNNHNSLPSDLKRAVGELPEPFLEYWLKRFPFLISVAWVVFQNLKTLTLFNDFYAHDYNFTMGQVLQEKIFHSFSKGPIILQGRLRSAETQRKKKFQKSHVECQTTFVPAMKKKKKL